MITITSFLHRDKLHAIIRRWMYGTVLPTDADDIVRLVHFNNACMETYLRSLSGAIFHHLHGNDISSRAVTRKGELKDVIVTDLPVRDVRVDELVRRYRRYPGRYYRETPFRGTLFFATRQGRSFYVGSSRIKRMRRLAEKAARRIIDGFFISLQEKAQVISVDDGYNHEEAEARPSPFFQGLLSRELQLAEERFLDDLQRGSDITGMRETAINDVAGIKVILDPARAGDLLDFFHLRDDIDVIEKETHDADYKATNFVIRYRLDRDALIASCDYDRLHAALAARGLDKNAVKRGFEHFVITAEDAVYMEIILSSYQEMLESEIGRCVHEDRIILQRLHREYRGHLARNIEYLMEYLFVFAHSPARDITELPIKLWNRYLPDYFDVVLKDLFTIERDHDL